MLMPAEPPATFNMDNNMLQNLLWMNQPYSSQHRQPDDGTNGQNAGSNNAITSKNAAAPQGQRQEGSSLMFGLSNDIYLGGININSNFMLQQQLQYPPSPQPSNMLYNSNSHSRQMGNVHHQPAFAQISTSNSNNNMDHLMAQYLHLQREYQQQRQQQQNQRNALANMVQQSNNQTLNSTLAESFGSFGNLHDLDMMAGSTAAATVNLVNWNNSRNDAFANGNMHLIGDGIAPNPNAFSNIGTSSHNHNIISSSADDVLNSSTNMLQVVQERQQQQRQQSLMLSQGINQQSRSPSDRSTHASPPKEDSWTFEPKRNSTGPLNIACSKQTDVSSSPRPQSQDGDVFTPNGIVGPWSAFSASRLGDMALSTGENGSPKKKIAGKAKDNKPKRPLSAYNIFFREERNRILEQIPDDQARQSTSTRKRKKRPHGKIGFESLAKTIGQRWQALSDQQLSIYKSKANDDLQRYKREMEAYVALEVSKQRKSNNNKSAGSTFPNSDDDNNNSSLLLEPTPLGAGSGTYGMFSQQLPAEKKSRLDSHMFRL